MLERIWGTVLLRPYVFAFLIAFVGIAVVQMGWRRMLVFAVIGCGFGFGSEALSIRTGIPFGHYEYLSYATRDVELWLCDVPVMASLSFVFLTYAGLATALVVRGEFDRRGPRQRFVSLVPTLHSPAVLVLAAGFTTLLDVVIDPVTLRGKQWFLGVLYRYAANGPYFGVPLSNFAGWFAVAFLIVAVFQLVDRGLGLKADGAARSTAAVTGRQPPAWPGVALYGVVLAFNVSVAFAIGHLHLGLVSSVISLAVLGFVVSRFMPPARRGPRRSRAPESS